ncbi:hypothetical protein EV674_11549 [Simplicispira metamorpha]|uniref:Uncharacterized protein n=1 Tax=Simplicispira metamorpha TaxID=80881 RepID=A0A4R2N7I6_9BURK|nr:hypothetical protein EV674_11549 [Simplicispira metamorpha]
MEPCLQRLSVSGPTPMCSASSVTGARPWWRAPGSPPIGFCGRAVRGETSGNESRKVPPHGNRRRAQPWSAQELIWRRCGGHEQSRCDAGADGCASRPTVCCGAHGRAARCSTCHTHSAQCFCGHQRPGANEHAARQSAHRAQAYACRSAARSSSGAQPKAGSSPRIAELATSPEHISQSSGQPGGEKKLPRTPAKVG